VDFFGRGCSRVHSQRFALDNSRCAQSASSPNSRHQPTDRKYQNRRLPPKFGTLPPHVARRSITFDRGTEFVSWLHLQAEIGTQTWFCDPSSPWLKGTVENTNRRAQRWLPSKRDITAITDHELKMTRDRLNATPRKCLGFKTPAEVFREKMLEVA